MQEKKAHTNPSFSKVRNADWYHVAFSLKNLKKKGNY